MPVAGNARRTPKYCMWRFLILEMCVVVYVPAEAHFGVDGGDSGVPLIGVCGAKLWTLTSFVLKLYTHCYWVSVCLWGRRHDAFNCSSCFPNKRKKRKTGKRCNLRTCNVYNCLIPKILPITIEVILAELHRSQKSVLESIRDTGKGAEFYAGFTVQPE